MKEKKLIDATDEELKKTMKEVQAEIDSEWDALMEEPDSEWEIAYKNAKTDEERERLIAEWDRINTEQ